MAGTKSKQKNINRFRMTYPYIRRRPRYELTLDKEVTLEVGEITFTNASSGTHAFTQVFTSAPTITAISVDSESNDIANVNIFVSSVSTTNVVIESSQAFTGKVHFHAIVVAT
jgi:hypothetical protein|tara:strand:+ start:148 stop:486 length:339 start_codon:yes stop_codon:yes gene_type:complete